MAVVTGIARICSGLRTPCHEVHDCSRRRFPVGVPCLAQQFCDTEVNQFRESFGRYQNIAWFYVAMDDEVLMCILHSIAYQAEEFQPLFRREFVVITILIDWFALDILHH